LQHLKTTEGNAYAKVIRTVRSEKTGAYVFTEELMPSDKVKEYLAKKK
jgi:hypothetical protein